LAFKKRNGKDIVGHIQMRTGKEKQWMTLDGQCFSRTSISLSLFLSLSLSLSHMYTHTQAIISSFLHFKSVKICDT
jgi:hypothetical protein